MQVGDLVRCHFQPSSSGYNTKTGCMKPMSHWIKNETGIVVSFTYDQLSAVVYFPQFDYKHTLSVKPSTLEVISAGR